MKLLYVHGYNGDPYGDSYQNLKEACGDKHELHTIDYNPEFPKHAIKDIWAYIKENNIDCVIGASLGGFLTMNLYGVSRIVVNPCWDPANELYKLGYRGDIGVYEELLDGMTETLDFEEKNLCTGVFAVFDELLGMKYVDTFRKYFGNPYIIVGQHRISKDMAKDIIDNILPNHKKVTEEFSYKLKQMDNAPWL